MMMNCFCGMVNWHKRHLALFPARIIVRDPHHSESDMPWAVFEPEQNLSSGLVEWSSAIVITTTSLMTGDVAVALQKC